MNNFKLHGVFKLPECSVADDSLQWLEQTWRQTHPRSSHKATSTIYFKMPKVITEHSVFNDLTSHWQPETPAWVMNLVNEAATQLGWHDLGRVMLVKLPDGGSISRHTDEGAYAQHYNRVHLVVKGRCLFECGDEIVEMRSGTLWQFNHCLPHSVVNNFGSSRVSLIIDGV